MRRGTDQGRKFVYVVNDQNAVEYKPVDLGPTLEGLRVVREVWGATSGWSSTGL